jgi:hypothetical protein
MLGISLIKDLESNLEGVIAQDKLFDVEYIMCAKVPHEDGTWGLKETQHAVDVFNKSGQVLKEYGLILVYHHHGYELVFSTFECALKFYTADNKFENE